MVGFPPIFLREEKFCTLKLLTKQVIGLGCRDVFNLFLGRNLASILGDAVHRTPSTKTAAESSIRDSGIRVQDTYFPP